MASPGDFTFAAKFPKDFFILRISFMDLMIIKIVNFGVTVALAVCHLQPGPIATAQ